MSCMTFYIFKYSEIITENQNPVETEKYPWAPTSCYTGYNPISGNQFCQRQVGPKLERYLFKDNSDNFI